MDSHECVTPDVKRCSKCGEVKPLVEFPKSKGNPKSECKVCFAKYHREYYLKNAEKICQRTQEYKTRNPEKVSEMMADWYKLNKDHVLERSKEYRSRPEVAAKEKIRSQLYYEARKEEIQRKRKERLLSNQEVADAYKEYQKAWVQANSAKMRAKVARRRSSKLQATPKWANKDAIEAMYVVATYLTETTGVKHEVDHVVPLKNKFVCGLHVENNLQVMKMTDNRSKANRFTG